MQVYFVRHGETLSNRRCAFQGADVPLSDVGRVQIGQAAEALQQLNADRILTSTLTRARESARIISERIEVPIEETALLAEIRRPQKLLGKWQYSFRSLVAILQIFFFAWSRTWHYSDEENPFDFYERCKKALYCIERQEVGTLIVVAHRGTLLMLLLLIREADVVPNFWRFLWNAYFDSLHNASITHCEYTDGVWRVLSIDRTEHLKQKTK